MGADRDEKGHFVKGHASTLPQRRPGANPGGRPKTPKGLVRDAFAEVDAAMPEILAAMTRRAIGKEADCPLAVRQAAAEYLCDRIYGRPNQPMSGSGDALRALLESYLLVAKGEGEAKG